MQLNRLPEVRTVRALLLTLTHIGSAERGIVGIELSQSEASSLRHRSSASDPVPTEEGKWTGRIHTGGPP